MFFGIFVSFVDFDPYAVCLFPEKEMMMTKILSNSLINIFLISQLESADC